MTENNLFDINLLKKKIKRARKYSEYDQLLFKLAAENISEIITSYNKNFVNVLDLSFFPQSIFSSHNNIDMYNSFPDAFDTNSISTNDKKYDLIISNLSIQSINNITDYLASIYSLLNQDGILIGSIFGNQTLAELKHSMILTESNLNLAHSPNVIPLLDIQKLGNLLQKIGYKMPVVDSNIYKLEYNNVFDLCLDLRKMGLTNHMYKRRKFFLGKQYLKNLNEIYKKYNCNDSYFQTRFEIFYFISIK